MLTIIYSIYRNAKYYLRQNSHLSDYFYSNAGIRKGEKLSPVFLHYSVKDLEEMIRNMML